MVGSFEICDRGWDRGRRILIMQIYLSKKNREIENFVSFIRNERGMRSALHFILEN